MQLRRVKKEDLPQIAKVHRECFQDSFLTLLGERLLVRYYLEFARDYPDLFWVAVDGGNKIGGFCMGYLYGNQSCKKKFLRHNAPAISFKCLQLLLQGKAQVLDKLKKSDSEESAVVVDFEVKVQPSVLKGNLLSICVLEKYRGSDTAQTLLNHFLIELKKIGRKYCLLCVEKDNGRALKFYKRNGFKLYKKLSDAYMFAKKISV